LTAGEKAESTLVSVELRGVPFPVVGWIWIGAALALAAVGLWVAVFSNPNLGFLLLFVGLASLPLNPRIYRRTRRLDLDTDAIRLLRRNFVVKVLPWNRVEKVQYGPRRWRRMKRTFPVGTGNERVYISFIASTDLESIRVDGFDYEVKPDEIERVLAAIADLTKRNSIPVEEKEWLVWA
jgi:hypothetical protein